MLTVAFILSTRRAGSTWLNAVLGSHAPAAALGEYFRPFEMPGHVACRLCEGNGLAECIYLRGIEAVPLTDAYAFASERLGKNVLIDCSKQLHWPQYFMHRPDIDVRFIHLVRHPCGYLESERRRRPGDDVAAIAAEWAEQNRNIDRFSAHHGLPTYLASYDLLADFPEIYMPPLCRFLGFDFEPKALAYWNFEHHGLGGNGASSLYIRDRSVRAYVTGDDAHYARVADHPLAADTRWKRRLGADEIALATSSPYAAEMARRLTVRW